MKTLIAAICCLGLAGPLTAELSAVATVCIAAAIFVAWALPKQRKAEHAQDIVLVGAPVLALPTFFAASFL